MAPYSEWSPFHPLLKGIAGISKGGLGTNLDVDIPNLAWNDNRGLRIMLFPMKFRSIPPPPPQTKEKKKRGGKEH